MQPNAKTLERHDGECKEILNGLSMPLVFRLCDSIAVGIPPTSVAATSSASKQDTAPRGNNVPRLGTGVI
jgi:hypothetical protein